MTPQEKRVFARISIGEIDDCWEWCGAMSGSGYGRITVNYKQVQAHRYVYSLFMGNIPNELDLCHKCDNRSCVNPNHLFIGSRSDNMRDAARKGRLFSQNHNGEHYCLKKTKCVNGHYYLPDNLLITNTGKRRCKRCTYESNRRSKLRKLQ